MAITQFKYENKCTAAEQELIEVWMHGACTDKEAARVLFKKNGHNKAARTVRAQRESIAQKTGSIQRADTAHLIVRLIDLKWIKVFALCALSTSPLLSDSIDINRNTRSRRNKVEQTKNNFGADFIVHDIFANQMRLQEECEI